MKQTRDLCNATRKYLHQDKYLRESYFLSVNSLFNINFQEETLVMKENIKKFNLVDTINLKIKRIKRCLENFGLYKFSIV